MTDEKNDPELVEDKLQSREDRVDLRGVFLTARQLLRERKGYFRIPTGAAGLDRILGGGIEQGALTEFYGEYRTGKTQICLQLLLSVTLPPEQGGMGAQAVFIDTEGNFRPERVRQMCGRYEIDPLEVLDNIFVGRANSTEKQIKLVSELDELIRENDIRLVVIDSLTANFRAEYIGESKLLERQQKLNQHLSQLNRISTFAEEKPVAVVFTNQVVGNIDTPFAHKVNAVGGHILAHGSTHRIELSRTTDFTEKVPVLKATVIDSPYLPEHSAKYKITEFGIEDAESKATQNFRELLAGISEGGV